MAKEDYVIVFDREQVEVACSWHGGMNSMLYAVCSTGGLTLGTQRPRDEDGRELTDEEWFEHISSELLYEVRDTIKEAKKQMKGTRGKERKALQNDIDVLENMTFEITDR